MGTFSVKVVNHSGRPVAHKSVTVDFGIWNGQSSKYTDESGWAYFENNDGDLVVGEIFINGESFGEYSTYDGRTYSITI